MQRSYSMLATLAAAGILAACGSDSNGTGGDTPAVNLSLAVRPAAGVGALSSLAVPYTVTDGSGNTLTFESVQLVAREIELKRADRDVVCGEDDSDTDDDSNDDSSDASSADDCEELEFGPIVLDLPLGGGVEQVVSVPVAAGSYDKLEFEIHKPESSDDAAFIAANPDFNGVSVRVTGTYNGQAFTYTSDLSVEQERELVPALVVDGTTPTNLTLFVDVNTWFRSEGGVLFDPRTANDGQPNEGVAKSNIERSLNAFEDDDRDGDDDHGDDSGSGSDDGTPDQGSGDN